jgi:hypothetical protein
MTTQTPRAMPISTAASSSFARLIRPGAELAINYADSLVKSIPAELFGRMAGRGAGSGQDVNSPAFNLGHLSIYPDLRILPLLGRDDLVVPLPYSADLFRAGTPCVDQVGGASGNTYPNKDLIVATYMSRYRVAIDALQDVSEERLFQPNPVEGRMRELFPLIGNAIAFLFVGHTQTHLGQISAWRRVMGLGSAM